MNIETKRAIIDYIRDRDGRGRLVKELHPAENHSGGRIAYNTESLVLHRHISQLTDEEYVRAYLVVRLACDLGYQPDVIELEKEYQAGRPKTIKPRIDLLVRRKGRKRSTFLFVETKDPASYERDMDLLDGQLFRLASLEDSESPIRYLLYYTVGGTDDVLGDRALIVDYQSYSTFAEWVQAGKISLDTVPADYGQARRSQYVNKLEDDLASGEKCLDKRVTRERFAYLRKDMHDVLWGGGGMNYNEIFSNLVKLFLAKIFDEATTPEGQPYRFQIQLRNGDPESADETYERMNALFKQAQQEELGYSAAALRNSVGIDAEKISPQKVAYVVGQLQGISLRENESKGDGDVLAEFFEGIVSEGFKQDKGQFFTHRNIVRLIVHGIGLDDLAVELVNGRKDQAKPRLPYICDPSCGSGTFLIEGMQLVTARLMAGRGISNTKRTREFIGVNFPDVTPNVWAREYIYGCEVYGDLGLATKVNMVLHGDGSINIYTGDPLGNGLNSFGDYDLPNRVSALARKSVQPNHPYRKPLNESFDAVISNPPFSIPKKSLPPRNVLEGNFLYFDKRNSENLFVERWYQLLREGGRLGVVLPESVFDTTENLYIRLFLYKYFNIKAVVSLPELAFQPFTSTKTSLLFAQKKTRREVEEYEARWRAGSREYQRLKRKVEKYQQGKDDDLRGLLHTLKSYLGDRCPGRFTGSSVDDALGECADDIEEVRRNPDWWIFAKVAARVSERIVMAAPGHIGYKRTKRGEQERPNELLKEDEKGNIVSDVDDPRTVLDYLRAEVKWD